jgi:DnaJ-domain-containing protein 1
MRRKLQRLRMTDHFAAFGERPRLWLDPEALKEKFLRLSGETHPDKFQEPVEKAEAAHRFAELNSSYNTLRQTRSRLVHFLELNGIRSGPQIQDVPAGVTDFFRPMSELSRRTDELLKQRAAANSPMLKVQLFERSLDLTSEIQEVQTRIIERIRGIEQEIRKLDLSLNVGSTRDEFIPAIQAAAAALGFLERWNAQLQQFLAALAF